MILNSLNPAQQEAVQAPLCHQLILAGAGSGKTRVLTHRIAWLLNVEHLSPFSILAVTFTNKAANEMRGRVEKMLHTSVRQMWVGTFHSISHRFLRLHWEAAQLPQHFQILDADDQLRLIRRLIQSLNLDDQRFPPKQAQWFINGQKEEGREPDQVKVLDLNGQTYLRIYQLYQEALARAGVIDFTDLLLKTCQVLRNDETIRNHYQQRFRALLVDEFQDTNTLQYQWLKLFAGPSSAVMIVGDDDQSIYGWRGARIENLQRFVNDFPSAKTIRLEQNYRSTGVILKAANALIAQNTGRMGKNLWTEDQEGDLITLYAAFNETDEAFYIVNRIRDLRAQYDLQTIAILYRSNAQSRVLEEALMQFGIPYRVYGGLRYFDRAEIKDALAYLRLILNRDDDTAFERIINTPPRGIGDRTLMAIREHAKVMHLSLWDALEALLKENQFKARAENALLAFTHLIKTLSEQTNDLPLKQQVEQMLTSSGLLEHFRKERNEKGINRVENLEELINAADQFTQEGNAFETTPLAAFLAYAALESNEEQVAYEDCIQLMTLHSAKGLEFPVVFLAGLEEELFPHYLSMGDPLQLEEERRLCYVGITRAMKKLFMTYSETRRMHGKTVNHRPSRFLREIPAELVDNIRFRTKVSRPAAFLPQQENHTAPFYIGQDVHHRIFGDGTILDMEGSGDDLKLKVRFKEIGTKMLIASYLTTK